MGLDLNAAPPEEAHGHLQVAPRRWAAASSAAGAQCWGSEAGPAAGGPRDAAAGGWRHVGASFDQDQRPHADRGPSSPRYMWPVDGELPSGLPARPGARPPAGGLFEADRRHHSTIAPYGASPRAPPPGAPEAMTPADAGHGNAGARGGALHPAADSLEAGAGRVPRHHLPPEQGPLTGWADGPVAPAGEEGRPRLPGPFLKPHHGEAWHAQPGQNRQPEQPEVQPPAAAAWRGQLLGQPSQAPQGDTRCGAGCRMSACHCQPIQVCGTGAVAMLPTTNCVPAALLQVQRGAGAQLLALPRTRAARTAAPLPHAAAPHLGRAP
jgi:hypothetical protein